MPNSGPQKAQERIRTSQEDWNTEGDSHVFSFGALL